MYHGPNHEAYVPFHIASSVSTMVFQSEELGKLTVKRMTEHYARDMDKNADDDVRTQVFNVHNGSIHLTYHYGPDKVTASERICTCGCACS